MINIVCFKWGDAFDAEYVNKLGRAIERHVTIPYSFTCFTENPKGVEFETKPFLNNNLPTWWYIIGLFNKEHNFKGKVVYFDLDTVILDNIDEIISINTNFAILRDFYRPKGLQTAFILWEAEWGHYLYDRLTPGNHLRRYRGGTNAYIEKNVGLGPNIVRFQDFFPQQLISYKVHIRDVKQKTDFNKAKIVFFHGRPRPHEVNHLEWMKKNWV